MGFRDYGVSQVYGTFKTVLEKKRRLRAWIVYCADCGGQGFRDLVFGVHGGGVKSRVQGFDSRVQELRWRVEGLVLGIRVGSSRLQDLD